MAAAAAAGAAAGYSALGAALGRDTLPMGGAATIGAVVGFCVLLQDAKRS